MIGCQLRGTTALVFLMLFFASVFKFSFRFKRCKISVRHYEYIMKTPGKGQEPWAQKTQKQVNGFATTVIKVTKMHLSGIKPCILAFTMKLLIIASCCSLLLSDATLLKIDRIYFLLKETFANIFFLRTSSE